MEFGDPNCFFQRLKLRHNLHRGHLNGFVYYCRSYAILGNFYYITRANLKSMEICQSAQALVFVYTPLFPSVPFSIATSIIRSPLIIEVVQMIISFRPSSMTMISDLRVQTGVPTYLLPSLR